MGFAEYGRSLIRVNRGKLKKRYIFPTRKDEIEKSLKSNLSKNEIVINETKMNRLAKEGLRKEILMMTAFAIGVIVAYQWIRMFF